MSLDQDNLGEGNKEKKEQGITRTRIVEADVENSYAIAREKERLGLPLNQGDKQALKAGKVIEELRKQKGAD